MGTMTDKARAARDRAREALRRRQKEDDRDVGRRPTRTQAAARAPQGWQPTPLRHRFGLRERLIEIDDQAGRTVARWQGRSWSEGSAIARAEAVYRAQKARTGRAGR